MSGVGTRARWVAGLTLALSLMAAGPDDPDVAVIEAPATPPDRDPEAEVAALLRPEASIIEARDTLDQRRGRRVETLAVLREQEARFDADLAKTTAAFTAATAKRDREREIVRARLNALSRGARRPSLHVLASTGDLNRFRETRRAMDVVIAADRERLGRYRELRVGWQRQKADLERRQRNVAHIRQAIENAEQELQWDDEELALLKAALSTQAAYRTKLLREMEEVDKALSARVIAISAEPRPRLYIEQNRGRLAHPINNGVLVGRFGFRRHEPTGARGVVRGLDFVPLRPDADAEVQAIYWGFVAFVGSLPGLGKVVILDHRKGYTSVYAHLSRIDVALGDKIGTGEALGIIGDTGSFDGKRLYLELRYEGRAVDPLKWLR